MRIVVYARGLTSEPTGRGVAARQLIDALRSMDRGHEIHVFSSAGVSIPGCRIHVARSGSRLRDATRFLWENARSIAKLQPDVVIGATHVLPVGLPRVIPRVVQVLDVVWRDRPDTVTRTRRLLARTAGHTLRRSSAVVCISRFTRDRVLVYWPELDRRVSVVHLAPSIPQGRPSPGTTPEAETPFLLGVDTIEPRKGVDAVCLAMRDHPDTPFVHCGAVGWRARRILALVDATPNVRRLGYVPETQLLWLYERAVAAVFPSEYEGFHLSALDAMSAGCPVVASDIPAHREVLGDAAAFFASGDVGALSDVLGQVLMNSGLRSSLAERGRAQAARFDRGARTRVLEDVVKGVVARSRPVS